jgi:hypothetical protein
MTDPIRDELHRINEEFSKLLGISDGMHLVEKTLPEQLIQRFGLTAKQARSWLDKEPNYDKCVLSDDSYHEDSNRRKVNRTLWKMVDIESLLDKDFRVAYRRLCFLSLSFMASNSA